jgi:hypothetical protein
MNQRACLSSHSKTWSQPLNQSSCFASSVQKPSASSMEDLQVSLSFFMGSYFSFTGNADKSAPLIEIEGKYILYNKYNFRVQQGARSIII